MSQDMSHIVYGLPPEDEIREIVTTKGSIFLGDLPKRLQRKARWTKDLELQGLLHRVSVKRKTGVRILLVAAGAIA